MRTLFSYIDLLVNNAGIVVPTHKPGSHTGDIKELQAQLWASGTAENWGRTFDVNVRECCARVDFAY